MSAANHNIEEPSVGIRDELMAEDAERAAKNKSEMWMKIASVVFGAWAAVVAYGAQTISSSVKELTDNQIRARARFDDFLVSNERRITQIEERQMKVLESIRDNQEVLHRHEQRLDRLELDGTRQSAQRILRDRAAP